MHGARVLCSGRHSMNFTKIIFSGLEGCLEGVEIGQTSQW